MNASEPRRTRTARVALAAGGLLLAACGGAASTAGPTPSPISPTSLAPVALASPVISPAASQLPRPGAYARVLIDKATAAVRANPDDSQSLLTLGLAWYQHARETADPSDYGRADQSFDRLLALKPSDTEGLIGKATIALARHQFANALALGDTARDQAPATARVWGVVGDALVELGRYDDSAAAVQKMVDLRPDLSSYSRVSYQRELRGHLDSAITAMEAAVLAGGPDTENTEYVRVLLGNLWFLAGDLDKAQASYAASLAHSPGYVYALGGLARVAAARGDLGGAIDLYQQATDRVPFPDLLIALGEAQEADGRTADSTATYRFVQDIEALFTTNGVNTDLDIALFEADHGDVTLALARAHAAYAEAPTVRAADALGWALYRNGRFTDARPYAEEALRLGSVEPAYLFHAGMIAAAQGDLSAARQWLSASLARNPGWSPLRAPIARQTLDGLPAAVSSPGASR